MNAYSENLGNVRYNENTRAREYADKQLGDGLISFICAVIGLVTCSAAIKLEKTIAVFALFVAFFGVIGGIESGALSWFFGIALCAVISLLEYVTLKSVFKPMAKS
ncbi:MAG: hypothetical protein IKJ24_03205 [Clostridia bacterium]|nr:hypothetical protein [Clostridia bacterium]